MERVIPIKEDMLRNATFMRGKSSCYSALIIIVLRLEMFSSAAGDMSSFINSPTDEKKTATGPM